MGVYDFDLESYIGLARRLGTDTKRVEVKAAAQGLPKSMAETLSAFSNTSGGVVVLGLAERAGFQAVPGFKARAVADALAQMCGEKMEPPVRASVEIVEFEGSPVVVATVPELPPELKPCFVKSRAMHDGSYARVGDGDRRLSPYEVDRLLEGRRPPHYDREVVEGAAMGDFDEELLEGFMRRQRADSPRAFKGMSDEELLEALCVTARDGEGIVRPTLAGLMALGRFPQRYFPRACLSFTVIPGTSKADVSAEGLRFLDSREIVGPIPVMISELMVALRRNVRVSSKVEGAFRIDRPEYPETAVREAVANALMHRDYSPDGCTSQVQVTMYDDRIEILSPGGLCRAMTVDRLGELGVSFPRNQALANILRVTPYAEGFAEVGSVVENKGTGYFQIRASLREANMPEPVAIDHITAFEVALYKAGAGAEAGWFGFGLGERAGGGGRGGVRLPEGAAGGKIVRSVTEWSDETGRFHTIHVLAPGTVECDIVDFLEEASAPVSSRILMDALGKSKATISRALNRLMDKSLVERLGPSIGWFSRRASKVRGALRRGGGRRRAQGGRRRRSGCGSARLPVRRSG